MPTRPLALALASLASMASVEGQGSFVNWETPHVHPLDLTPDGARLLAVNLPDGRLEVFDVTSGSPVWQRSIPVGLDPCSVRARSSSEAWVANHLSDSVSVVDLASGRVVRTLPTDDEPADVVFAGDEGFVSCSQANTVLAFDLGDLTRPPTRIPILGEDPRAMAVSPGGNRVYVAVFESSNETTVIGQGGFVPYDFPYDIVGLPTGPHGGVNPPPNDGAGFEPPIGPSLPAPPEVALIVKHDGNGRWLDDNGGDWTDFVSGAQSHFTGRVQGWAMLDHDLAILDRDTHTVGYADHLMNLCMALAVNPASGEVAVVGTDGTNEIRYQPNLQGRFLRVLLARVDPAAPNPSARVDVNPHLDYTTATVDQALRDRTLSDPRGIVWNGAGTRAYVTGLGTDNVIVLDGAGTRAGLAPTIEVGAGPTGIALDEPRQRLYVLNRFEASISVVSTASELELARVPFSHHSVHPQAFQIVQDFKIPSLRNLYERIGFDGTVAGNTAGFGYRNDGAIDSLTRFVARPHFQPESDQEVADIVAFLLGLSGETELMTTVDVEHPPGSPGQMTHAAVGKQATFDGGANPAGLALLALLVAEAEQGDLGIVARARLNGLERGFYYDGNDRFQSDRRAERITCAALLATAAPGAELTITAVPEESQRRIGADRDSDGALDRDELDLGFDPADARSHPKVQRR